MVWGCCRWCSRRRGRRTPKRRPPATSTPVGTDLCPPKDCSCARAMAPGRRAAPRAAKAPRRTCPQNPARWYGLPFGPVLSCGAVQRISKSRHMCETRWWFTEMPCSPSRPSAPPSTVWGCCCWCSRRRGRCTPKHRPSATSTPVGTNLWPPKIARAHARWRPGGKRRRAQRKPPHAHLGTHSTASKSRVCFEKGEVANSSLDNIRTGNLIL